ncbi:MAG: NAD-dependent epimerase/dehydratase family protein [Clostridia bacterium]|nr:NAD-dependent epimerase/dehydratase family protein [Clostridia bacterium]
MKITVIGGKGKVANYLLPLLVREGHEVVAVSRGRTAYYLDAPEFREVREVALDRADPDFPDKIASLGSDAVVDMICFKNEDMLRLIERLKGAVSHYVACGSLWYHGANLTVPVTESEFRNPEGEYGIQKLAMSDSLCRLWTEEGFPGTIVHPGHIVAPLHDIINPQGNTARHVFEDLRDGREVLLPNFGLETLHHVHAKDVAGVIDAAIRAGKPAFGEDFHAASSRAVTLRGYAEEVASWYGKEARLVFLPFREFAERVPARDAAQTLEHISRSPAASMEKARRVLGYTPVSSYEAIRENLESVGLL